MGESMSKETLMSFVVFFGTMLFGYFLVSFALWELNPSKWSVIVRGMYSGFAPLFSLLAVSTYNLK
jgi:hypothetical protein